jgi:predicted enzyme related to lactoylglutathione lyase
VPRVIHFEIHAEDPDRASRFYQALLGWEFAKWSGPMEYWVIKTGPADQRGVDGGLFRRRGPGPVAGQAVNAFVCTVDCSSVDDLVRRIPGMGGSIVVPKMPIPGIGWLAYAKDTEGNIFGFMQADPTARLEGPS